MGGDDSNSLLREAAPLRERTIPVYVASALIALLAAFVCISSVILYIRYPLFPLDSLLADFDAVRAWLKFSVLDFYVLLAAFSFLVYGRERERSIRDRARSRGSLIGDVADNVSLQHVLLRTCAWVLPAALLGSPVCALYVAVLLFLGE